VLYSIVRPNNYQDSLRLMRLSNTLGASDGLGRVSVMMGTPLNKDILRNAGMATEDLDEATAADLLIFADVVDEEAGRSLVAAVDSFLSAQASLPAVSSLPVVRSLDRALAVLEDANLAVVSVAGDYAAAEARRWLERDLNVLLFSDNVSVGDEVALKHLAGERGLLVMGPDCGTACIHGVALGFANVVAEGNIGLVGASGTGVQEVMVQIDRLRGGVSHAIGLGGRDLTASVGGLAAVRALRALDADAGTEAIVLISKPPDPGVRARLLGVAAGLSKPVVAVVLGERPARQDAGNVHYAHTLDEAARIAVELAGTRAGRVAPPGPAPRAITALYPGGTFAAAAASLIAESLGTAVRSPDGDGHRLRAGGHEVIDLGDDAYTRGRPHPMIDPSVRNERVAAAIADPQTAAVVLDVVLGYGAHPDPAGVLAPVVAEGLAAVRGAGRDLAVVASVCGTERDPQVLSVQTATLEQAGVLVMPSNAAAVRHALNILNRRPAPAGNPQAATGPVAQLLSQRPRIINVGLREFADALVEQDVAVVQYDWSPVAGGDRRMQQLLDALGG
jgi:FdrA protein